MIDSQISRDLQSMLEESLVINACLRNGHISTLYEIFPTLPERDYPSIFKETFPNACLYDQKVAEQMIEHLYKPLNCLDRSALSATIIYAKNMLIRKIGLFKHVPSKIVELDAYQSTLTFLTELPLDRIDCML